ncbi:hypothetical protein AGMMS49944_08990 [Spirochaetia bacterium]|nr:hypothetical protein AGMMS49944_08990 [Spirochaetia bacterium]
MPKSFNHLWEHVIDFENLYHAFREAQKGKRYRWESMKFKQRLEDNLIIMQNDLIWNTYVHGPYRQFYVTEPKKRLISAPSFRDRVVHHALCQVIEPIFENRFVNETFACRTGRGTHAAVMQVAHCTRRARREWGNYFILKCDIHHFFPSVNHDVLKEIIRRQIRNKKVMDLCDLIIHSYESAEQDGIGIPIGALTSQLFANIYLTPMDQRIKNKHHVKYYARYMDDFLILSPDKNYLWDILGDLECFLHDELKLNLNPKTGIFPAKHGVDYCGYRIWPTHLKPRKTTVKRAKRRMKKLAMLYRDDPSILDHAKASLVSFMGYIKHCSGWRTTKAVLERAIFIARAKVDTIPF